MPVKYPDTRRDDTVDDYHGRSIADPYRWMEDLERPDLRRWIDEQNTVTERYLQSLPLRAHFRERITSMWDYPKVSVPVVEAGRLFYHTHPATLVCTADFDDRVVPSHSFKFTAALQRAQGGGPEDRPVLIRIETHGSHGYRPTDKRIAELADQWAFAAAHAGLITAAVPESGSRPVR